MNSSNLPERDRRQQEFGQSDERIRQLEQQVIRQREAWESAASEWHRFLHHQSDLGEWLIDAATNADGRVVKSHIDAALGGESCVPCSFTLSANGRRYQFDLVSTDYEVKEV